MVTNAEEPEAPVTTKEQVADAAYAARDTLANAIRYTVAGDPQGRIRRGVLYLTAAAGIMVDWTTLALLAVLLLAWTDNVIEVRTDD